MVETVTVNGFPLRTIGDTYALLVFDAQRQIGEEQLAALVPELPELVASHEVPVDGLGVLRAYMLAVEPDLVALDGLLTAGLPGVSVAVLKPLLPVISQLDRKPQLFDTMTGWREIADARGPAAVGGRRPVRDGRLGVAARLDHRPHAHARRPHAPADARRVRGGPRRPHEPVQARLRRPLGRARGLRHAA